MALTDVEVRTAKAVAKPLKLFDGGGLHLRIDPKGSKLWRLAYRFGGNLVQKVIKKGKLFQFE